MSYEIPIIADDPRFSVTVNLNEVDFVLSFLWNGRANRWFFAAAKADGTAVVSGVALVVDYPFLIRFASEDLPDGALIALDSDGGGREAGRYDLGARVKLLFYNADELS